jgi:hypothetical protein
MRLERRTEPDMHPEAYAAFAHDSTPEALG